ncbi:MAG: PQQ-binding-like beta-propeller repeat protein [Caldilineaceae bacterium]
MLSYLCRRKVKFPIQSLLLIGLVASAMAGSGCNLERATGLEQPSSLASTPVDWLMEGGGPERSRTTTEMILPPLVAQERYVVGGDTQFVSPVAVTADFLLADGDHRLHAFGRADGQEKWRIDLPGSYLSPAIADNTVYVRAEAGQAGFVVALDSITGQVKWRFPFPKVGSEFGNVGGHVTSPLIVNELVLIGAARTMYALDAATGAVVWHFDSVEPIASSAAVTDDIVYFSDFTHIYAVDLPSGQAQWQFQQESMTLFFAPIIAQERVIIADHDTIQALSRMDGQPLWQQTFPKEVIPAAATADQIFVKTVNQLWALNAENGEILWDYSALNFVSLPAITDRQIYIITRSDGGSQLRALQRTDGKEQWRTENLPLSNSAPVAAQGAVYIRTVNGGVIGYRAR